MVPHNPAEPFETKHFVLTVDPATGSIIRMRNRTSGREWASERNPIALFTYQTLSSQDYADFIGRYITVQTDWAPHDFGKPGIEKFRALSREWHPGLIHCWKSSTANEERLLLELAFNDTEALATGNLAWPDQIFLELRLPANEPRIDLLLVTFGKKENRMPESMWLTLSPLNAHQEGWILEKIDQVTTQRRGSVCHANARCPRNRLRGTIEFGANTFPVVDE